MQPRTSGRPSRTVLAVPGHRLKMLSSAAASATDGVFIDLEDAVPPAEKAEALQTAIRALNELDWGSKIVAVRVNSTSEGVISEEICELASMRRLDSILIPKVESVDVIRQTELLLEKAGREGATVDVEALIETATGLVNVDTIAAAGGRLSALHFGVGDFSASIGARNIDIGGTHAGYAVTRRDDVGNYTSHPIDLWSYPMMRILVAARANGLRAIDGPCGAFRDAVLSRSFALKAAAMGFDGKQVIHPDQIEPTKVAFSPTVEEINRAEKTLAAMRDAESSGLAAVSVEGRMVDYANVRMANRVLLMAGKHRLA
ncbi:HpcH/HpaI aldolase/citrate lyase family protein [Variovorax sp. HW608]|uniref:HpcH/HpaI aldolase/citrate lyase family protein n=1 Tax=Variovorax sp. HW608 TaxID=1034889 RepID=UPI000B5AC93D|nr:CoA ester lyase [Variovorax sp. HW608]